MTRITTQSALAGLLAATTVLFGLLVSCAENDGQKAFKTPEAAGEALVAAAKANDTNALVAILGPESEDLVSSGDPVADESLRERFGAAYEQKHQWTSAPEGLQILEAGESDWPFPIPLGKTNDGWHFDTARGHQEILDRRIGRNELRAIQACLAFVDAEREYYARNPQGGTPQYTQLIASTQGKKDGLFWKAAEGEDPSPLGALFAAARAEGYSAAQGSRAPYQGYVYRVLGRQGDDAHGGAFDYVVDGAMTNGFALLASPAKYGASGVMTFLVNQTGVIYEKDLGPDTAEIAAKTEAFDPDVSWGVVSADARVPPDAADAS